MATLFATAPPGAIDQAFGQDTSTFSSKKIRRDLGEKGQIVIESLELNQADIGDVVRLLARLAGINIITGDIRGSITVYLESVTVQDAMEAILASQGYGFIFDGNIVRVVEASRLGEDRVQTITETFILNYLPAADVANTLKNVFKGGQSLGGSFSQIEANVEANAVIVVDTPSKMEDIRRLIYILDRRFEQVEIEGRFIEISYTQDQQWGVDWQYFQDPANALDVNLAPQPLDAQNVAGQFKFAVISGSNNLNGFIQALETNNDIRILANPKILALENQPALIELIDEIPFVEANISQGVITESVQFQETGIRLQVTPSIAHDDDGTFVRMTLDLEQRIPGPNVVLQNSIAFPIDSRHAQTDLIVPDETTIIIGGLKSNDLTYTYEKIPFLGSVPFLGTPFRRRAKNDNQTELILFVTPRVIYTNPPLDMKEQDLHDKIEEVMDSLETQADWRERVEAPIDMVDKGILYSGVECNDERYDRVVEMKNTIEGIKPYRVSKPKGIRKVRIDETGQYVEEAEYVDEATVEGEGPGSSQPGEVRDFSIIKEKARPGEGDSGVQFLGEDEEDGGAPAPIYEEPAPPPLPEPPPAAPSEDSGRPSWLRRGAQSDAGEQPLNMEEILDFDGKEEAIAESEPRDLESSAEATALVDPPLDIPPVDVDAEGQESDPWGLPAEIQLEIPYEEEVQTEVEPPAAPAREPTRDPQPDEKKEKPREQTAVAPVVAPSPPTVAVVTEILPPVSELPEKMTADESPVEVEPGKADVMALPADASIVGMILPPKTEEVKPSAPIETKPIEPPRVESAPEVAVQTEAIAAVSPAPVVAAKPAPAPAPIAAPPAPAPEVINLTGLMPAAQPKPVEPKAEALKVADSNPVQAPVAAAPAAHEPRPVPAPQTAADVSVVDLRGKTTVEKPEPDLRSLLDPSILDALKQMEANEGTAPSVSNPLIQPPAASEPFDPWSPMAEIPIQPKTPSESVPLLAQNEMTPTAAAPTDQPEQGRSWWKRFLGKD